MPKGTEENHGKQTGYPVEHVLVVKTDLNYSVFKSIRGNKMGWRNATERLVSEHTHTHTNTHTPVWQLSYVTVNRENRCPIPSRYEQLYLHTETSRPAPEPTYLPVQWLQRDTPSTAKSDEAWSSIKRYTRIQCQDVHMDHRTFSGVSEVKNNVGISTATTTIS